MQRYLLLALFLMLPVACLHGQTVTVKQYIQQVASGWTSDAKKALPDLLIDSPDDPGVLFLHASMVEDHKKATPLLERIVNSHPRSEWADDALARLVIFAASQNDAEKAKKTFTTMREQYSQSELLSVVYDVMRSTVGAPPPADKTTAAVKRVDAPVEVTPKSAKPYTLVTRSTFSKDEADKLMEQLKKKRMRVRITTSNTNRKTRYIVSVGEYESEADAEKDVAVVRAACSCKPTITKR